MDEDGQFAASYLAQLEEAGEDVLSCKQQIIDMDRLRNKTREALRAARAQIPQSGHTATTKTWICLGNIFIKMPTAKSVSLLESEFARTEEEIKSLRLMLRTKVDKLRDIEKSSKLKGFDLKALSPEELKAVNTLLR